MDGLTVSRRDALLGAGAVGGLALVGTRASAQATAEGARIDAAVAASMAAYETPGVAVALVRAGGQAYLKGYGVRALGRPERVDTDTLFGIASNSKSFTAAALALLVEEGKIGWDEPVRRYLPDFATSDPDVTRLMTVRDLLCHRSGLPLGAGDLMQFPLSDHSRADIVRGLRYLPFARGFRSGYAYDNILYIVAGVVVERVAGMPFEDFVTRRLLQPIGMRGAVADRSRIRTANVVARHAQLGPPARGLGPVTLVEPDESPAVGPAGGINASVTDIALWLRTQLALGVAPNGRRLWSEASAREMWTPQVITGTATGPTVDNPARGVVSAYALGWGVGSYRGHRLISHSGGLSGQQTQTALFPELGIGVAVFTSAENGSSGPLRNAVLDIAVAAPPFDWLAAGLRARDGAIAELRSVAGGADFTAPPGSPSLPLAAYAGRYRDPWYGDIVVAQAGGRLTIDFTRTPVFKSALEPFGSDAFRTRFPVGAGEDAVVTFVIEGGRPVRLKLRALSPLADFSYDFHDLNPVRVG